jgi:hypothetical protein
MRNTNEVVYIIENWDNPARDTATASNWLFTGKKVYSEIKERCGRQSNKKPLCYQERQYERRR